MEDSEQHAAIPDEQESVSDIAEQQFEPSYWLTRSDQFFLLVVVLFCLTLFGINRSRDFFSHYETVEIKHLADHAYLFQIEINSATWVEWMQLDGVGETTARKIIQNRAANGPFQSIAGVTRVNGIGPAKLAKMKPHLHCNECP